MPNTPFTPGSGTVVLANLNVSQGSNGAPQPVFNRLLSFATSGEDLNLVFLMGSDRVSVSAVVTAGDPGQIRWQIDRDPADGEPGVPSIWPATTAGQITSFLPASAGNFRLIAYVDSAVRRRRSTRYRC